MVFPYRLLQPSAISLLSESVVNAEEAHHPLALWAVIKWNDMGFPAVGNSDLPFLGRESGHGGRGN